MQRKVGIDDLGSRKNVYISVNEFHGRAIQVFQTCKNSGDSFSWGCPGFALPTPGYDI